MAKKDVTDGERLCTYLKHHLFDSEVWPTLPVILAASGRGDDWAGFFEEVVVTQLVGRLVTAGSSFADDLGGRAAIETRAFEQRLRALIAETTQAAFSDRETRDRVYKLAANAVGATFGNVTEADDKILRTEAARPPRCYLCNRILVMKRGDAVQSLSAEDRELAVEYEHIWPRSYGGNTMADNLALACHGCNQRKQDFANWAMVDVQAVALGWNPGDNVLGRVTGWRRFALVSRAAHQLADRESLTLKQAYLRLQPVVLARPRVQRVHDAADFFNLSIHGETD